MGSRSVFHKSEKRKKELARQKKQEEKKMRKLNKTEAGEPEDQELGPEDRGAEQEKRPGDI
jgi:hypothetical protein